MNRTWVRFRASLLALVVLAASMPIVAGCKNKTPAVEEETSNDASAQEHPDQHQADAQSSGTGGEHTSQDAPQDDELIDAIISHLESFAILGKPYVQDDQDNCEQLAEDLIAWSEGLMEDFDRAQELDITPEQREDINSAFKKATDVITRCLKHTPSRTFLEDLTKRVNGLLPE